MKTELFILTLLTMLIFFSSMEVPIYTENYTPPKTLKFKRVKSSKVNEMSLKALRDKYPALVKGLNAKGTMISASQKIALFESQRIVLVMSTQDLGTESANTVTMSISGYEKVPIDIIGNAILFAICQCEEGSDDCYFERDEDGNIGECITGGECSDCRGGFELSGPDGDIFEVQAM
jgi:hypothetical protein